MISHLLYFNFNFLDMFSNYCIFFQNVRRVFFHFVYEIVIQCSYLYLCHFRQMQFQIFYFHIFYNRRMKIASCSSNFLLLLLLLQNINKSDILKKDEIGAKKMNQLKRETKIETFLSKNYVGRTKNYY